VRDRNSIGTSRPAAISRAKRNAGEVNDDHERQFGRCNHALGRQQTGRYYRCLGWHYRHCLARQHLRNILAYLDLPTLGHPEAFMRAKDGLFDTDGGIGAASRQFLQGWMDRYMAWIKRHTR
jgi:hypothetical protein